mgnify:FL=1
MAELKDKELNEVNGGWEELNPNDFPKPKALDEGNYDLFWYVPKEDPDN